jgi:hypothetical protein
MEELLPV